MKGIAVLLLSLFGLLAGATAFAWYVWEQLGDVAISEHGYYAMALGITVALLLGAGLMWLVYFSHHRGYDDEAGGE